MNNRPAVVSSRNGTLLKRIVSVRDGKVLSLILIAVSALSTDAEIGEEMSDDGQRGARHRAMLPADRRGHLRRKAASAFGMWRQEFSSWRGRAAKSCSSRTKRPRKNSPIVASNGLVEFEL